MYFSCSREGMLVNGLDLSNTKIIRIKRYVAFIC